MIMPLLLFCVVSGVVLASILRLVVIESTDYY